ncbi:MAG TPA: DUF4230 domain-containing protein [Micromonosporaceae bacterium]
MTRPDNAIGGSTPRQPSAGDPHPTAELPPVGELDSGTGWPDGDATTHRLGDDGTTRPLGVGGDPATRRLDLDAPPRRGGVLRGVLWLVAIVVLIGAVLYGSRSIGVWPHFGNPFAEKKTDRSQPALLKSIQDLSRFEAASGNFQVVIDVQKDRSYIPDLIFSDRILFVAAGSVDAYVDFSGIGAGAITESADHRTVTVHLPAPQLDKPNIDHDKSYVFAESRGLANRVGDLFGGDPNKQQELYQLAEDRIAAAAKDSGLAQRAADNTRKMLEQMLRSLGYQTITVTVDAP